MSVDHILSMNSRLEVLILRGIDCRRTINSKLGVFIRGMQCQYLKALYSFSRERCSVSCILLCVFLATGLQELGIWWGGVECAKELPLIVYFHLNPPFSTGNSS